MDLQHLPRLLTVEEAATFLRLTTDEVIQAIAGGELTVVRLDEAVFVDTDVLLEELGVDAAFCGSGYLREVMK